jgi:hypothetical protein
MAFLNRLRSFSEWHDTDDHLDAALRLGTKKRTAFSEAQGDGFREFARKQPGPIQDALFKIDGAMKSVLDAAKISDESISKIRSEIAKLRPLNDDIKAKRKQTQAVRDRFEKSQKATARAQERLEQIRAKATNSPEFAKAQDEYDIALKQRQVDQEAAEARDALLITEIGQYKQQFTVIVLNAMEQYAFATASASASLVLAGQQLQQHAGYIGDFDDPGIEILQSELQQLNSEPIE